MKRENYAKLGEVCDVRDGTHDSPKYVNNGYPLVTSKNIVNGKIDITNINYISEDDYNKINQRSYVDDGDIIMPMIGTIGKPALVEKNFDFAIKNVALIKFYEDSIVENRYVKYLLESDTFKKFVDRENRGGTQKFLSLRNIRNFEVPIRDKKTQKHIADLLDKSQLIINKQKEMILACDELIKSQFIEMFGTIYDNKHGYEIKSLQQVCEQIKDGTHKTPEYTDDTVSGYKFLSSKDVTTGKIDWNHIKYIPESLHKELYARIAPRRGDILLAKNGTTGVAAIVDRDEIFDIYVSLAILRPVEIEPIYLWAAVNSAETKRQFHSSLKGIGVPNLHLGEIKKTLIIVPPIELQKQFAIFAEQIDKSKLAMKKSLEEMETLYKSLLQKYFG